MKLGITGHQRLARPEQWVKVELAIKRVLDQHELPLQGISCLAVGADQLFARLILERGGSLEAIIPFPDIERTFQSVAEINSYRHLREQAIRVEVLNWKSSDEHAFLAAGQRVADQSDVVVAVWNGKPAAGLGGTADIVAYAMQLGRPVEHINPDNI